MKKNLSATADIRQQRERQVDRDIGAAITRLLETVAGFYEICSSDEIAQECEMKRAPEIRKILLQSFRNNQIRKRNTKTCKH